MASLSNTKDSTLLHTKDCSFFDRVLGAAAILLFVSTWISSILSPFLLAYALYWGYHLVSAAILAVTVGAYLPWTKGPLAEAIRQFEYYYFARYFAEHSLVVVDDDDKTKKQQQTFYAVHPHGAFSFGWATLFLHYHQSVRFCFSPALYYSPFFRLFSRLTGMPGSADKKAMISYMKAGHNLALPPGGFEEATLTALHQDRVYIEKRTGFVKLCLQHGLAIRPVYAFGEKGLYWNLQGFWKFRIGTLNKQGFPAILVWGQAVLPLLPRSNVPLHIVVGPPLVLPQIDQPSKDCVREWHGKYVAALTRLFETHKETAYGPEMAKTAKLEIW